MSQKWERISLRVAPEDRKEVSDEELRAHQLVAKEALDEVKTVCEKHDIPYYLLAGSCLGAVRHGGFIPWDDDIDIGIPERDYERFENAISAELPEKYTWISNRTTERYPRLFGKVLCRGIGCVDCFQLVKTADTPRGRRFHRFVREIWLKVYLRKINSYWSGENRLYYAISVLLAAFLSRKSVLRLARRNEARYRNRGTHYYMNINSVYSAEKETIKAEWLEPPGKVSFDGTEYLTVNDTDAYLTHLYGDYMTPPPVEKRGQHHILIRFAL